MNWVEITIEVETKDLEKAGDIANMVVPYGIYIEDYSELEDEVLQIANIDLIDEDLLKKDRNKGLIHIYISPEDNPKEAVAYLTERYESERLDYKIGLSNCEDEDWLNNWKQYFYPIEIGERLLIRPTWREKYDCKDRVVIDLDPGLAFGTGTHETTRLCLKALEKYISGGERVLDVGCGSGILGIAALLLGAEQAQGIDIDELAVKTAKENAALNNVSEKFEIMCGNLSDKASGKYDVITANIVADAIMLLSENITDFMNESSVYIMSGIIDSRADEVKSNISDKLTIMEEYEDNGWYCLVASLKNS
ncbi:MAG: 50S ribosomal protein L11 methyltransferase [Clostridiales bacterium]|nr:50S ribosomal protein L11 methyltransferase [Clostridiales bacterium]